jgi:hypothetical protein
MRVHSTDSAAFQNFATAMANQIAQRSDVMAKLEDKAPDIAAAVTKLANKGKHVPPTMPRPPVAQPVAVAVVARKPAVAPGQIVAPDGAPTRVLTKIDAVVGRAHANAAAHAQAASPTGNPFGITRGAPAEQTDASTVAAASDAADQSTAAPIAPADLGKAALEDVGVTPQQPTLQVQLQYATLAKRMLALAPVATHDTARTTQSDAKKADHRRVDVTA